METKLSEAAWSVLVFAYYQTLTFMIGGVLMNRSRAWRGDLLWRVFFSWLLGFAVLSGTMTILGSLHQIRPGVLWACNLLFWVLILLGNRIAPVQGQAVPQELRLGWPSRREWFLLSPLLVLLPILFFACLVPPTGVDELKYSFYFVRSAVMQQGFLVHQAPPQIWTPMAIPSYNIWSFAAGAEYAPALNSFFSYAGSLLFAYSWIARRFGRASAWVACLMIGSVIQKAVRARAPGDNATNFLLLFVLAALVYDLMDDVSPARLFFFHLLAFLSVVGKFTALALIVPLVPLLWITWLKRKSASARILLFGAAGAAVVLLPFLLKNWVLYRNPIFPLGSSLWGAGPFDPEWIQHSLLHQAQHEGMIDLLRFLFVYVVERVWRDGLNPLYWFFFAFGLRHLFRSQRRVLVWSLAACYVVAFFRLPNGFFRFFLGFFDFFMVVGVAECMNSVWIQHRLLWFKWLRRAVIFSAYLSILVVAIHFGRYAGHLFSSESRASFLRSRVACYETIEWVNTHLPKDSFILTETLGCYYYDLRVESIGSGVFGKSRSLLKEPGKLYEHLRANGVTHLMLQTSHWQSERRDLFYKLCQDPAYAEKIYENFKQLVRRDGFMPPQYGRAAVYRLK